MRFEFIDNSFMINLINALEIFKRHLLQLQVDFLQMIFVFHVLYFTFVKRKNRFEENKTIKLRKVHF